MIEIKNVTKVFGKDFVAVANLDLTIANGEIFGFLGPNGAGKTTTLKMITGITPITQGEILINSSSIKTQDLEAKKHFGFIPDNPDVLIKLKGIEYLDFIASIYGVKSEEKNQRVKELAVRFELTDALEDRIENYSHGMRQKLLVIGVLLHSPENWILDEPMTGLDPKSSFILKEMMREHANAGNTVLFSTHVLEVAEKICDRVGIINHGKLIFVGTVEELREKCKENSSLEDLFLELTNNE